MWYGVLECIDDNLVIENEIENHEFRGIANHIKHIYENSKSNALTKGNRLSAYFLPDITKHVLRLCNDLTLCNDARQIWTYLIL